MSVEFVQCGELRIAFEQCGDPSGRPVFFCHGWPASRLQGAGFGDAACELGIRLITPDRPGIGLSTFQERRRLMDWPPLLAGVADGLGVGRFRIFGVSGGGPYALAAAWSLPDRVEAAAVVSGAPPLPPETDRGELLAVYRWLLTVYRRRPALLRQLFAAARPLAMRRPPSWTWPWLLRFAAPADAAMLSDPAIFEGSFECYREAWRGSARGVVADAEVYAHDWGFPVEEIRTPVRLWHGKQDRSFSWKLAERLCRRLTGCEARFVEGEGHYSLPIRHRRDILADLLQAGSPVATRD